MTPFVAELVGTMIMIIFGGGVVAGVNLKKTLSHQSGWIVIAFGWGFAVMLAAYAVGNVSGAHLNPALTIGLAAAGRFAWGMVPSYILAQVIGAFLGAVIVWLHYYPHWKGTEDQIAKLRVFSTMPAVPNNFFNLISEVVGTFCLVFIILALGGEGMKFADGLQTLIVGFLIVAIGLSLGGTTGYAINPARDFGPRLAHFILPIPGKGNSGWGYSWIPIVGPVMGGILAAWAYIIIF
ncbi:MIP/aquaporin family protein [Thermoactinomyces mirandus]|uniref:Aquaporin family protein n=1 Tax=Thermoactinomyces mirandus TaxID=2756294 RepID=A0A7W1XV51_9BACL|nr:MIP/aquaporin family protein [Thermoactinomyces mirandus]MBA4603858.1 aquaporin family protein [Thermoactinomyces mirandus]